MQPESFVRFANCKFYDRCLTVAAHEDTLFSCEQCRRYWPHKQTHVRAMLDAERCRVLWAEVFSLKVPDLQHQVEGVPELLEF